MIEFIQKKFKKAAMILFFLVGAALFAASMVAANDALDAPFVFSLDKYVRFSGENDTNISDYPDLANLEFDLSMLNREPSENRLKPPPIFRLYEASDLQEPILKGIYSEGIGKKRLNVEGFSLRGILPSGLEYETRYGSIDEQPTIYLYHDFSEYQLVQSKGMDPDYSLSGKLRWMTPLNGFVLGGSLSSYRLLNDTYRPDILPWSDTAMAFFTNDSKLYSINTAVASAEQHVGDMTLFVEYKRDRYIYDNNDIDDHIAESYSGGVAYRFTDWFELTSHFSIYYADKNDKDGKRFTEMGKMAAEAWLKDFALKTEFDVNSNLKIQVEGHVLEGMMGVANLDDPLWLRYAAKMTFSY